jgi:hypothetical protein
MALQTYNDYLVATEQAFTTAGATTNNLALQSTTLNITPTTTGDTITGVSPPIATSGGILIIANAAASNTLVLAGNNAGSLAANRFQFAEGAASVTLAPSQTATFSYVNGSGWRFHRPAPLSSATLGTERRTFTQDFSKSVGLITALTGITTTQSVPGLLTTDAVSINVQGNLSGAILANAWVSSADTLSMTFNTAVALGVTLGALTFRLSIFR